MATAQNALVATAPDAGAIVENVVVKGDLKDLSPVDRANYYKVVCQSIGLNPLTKPFEYITLNGKLTLYARKDATDQLRSLRGVSVTIVSREQVGDVYMVIARATTPDGRTDESIGAVTVGSLKGDALANALMKAETKAKRRVTLSICGLGMLDETETETIPGATIAPVEAVATIAEEPATEEQVTYLGHILDALNNHGIDDDKLAIAIRNITRRSDMTLEPKDLLTLSNSQMETVITRLDAKLKEQDAAKEAKYKHVTDKYETDMHGYAIDDLE